MAAGSPQKGAKYLAAEGEAAAEVAQQPAAAPSATAGAAASSSPAGSFRKPDHIVTGFGRCSKHLGHKGVHLVETKRRKKRGSGSDSDEDETEDE